MSEHLQFSPIAKTTTRAQGSGAKADGAPGSLIDAFAALLDLAKGTEAPAPDGAEVTAALATQGTATVQAEIAAEIALTPPDTGAVLKDFVATLKALQTALDAGQPADPKLVQRLNADIDALSAALNLPQPEKPDPADALSAVLGLTAAIVAPPLAPLAAAGGKLLGAAAGAAIDAPAPAVAPTLAALPAKLVDLGARVADQDADLAARLSALGEQLGSGKVSAEAIARMNLPPAGSPADAELNTALKALLAETPPAVAKPVPQGPQLATPQLPTPELATAPTPAKSVTPAEEPAPDLTAKIELKAGPERSVAGPTPQSSEHPMAAQTQSAPAAKSELAAALPPVAADAPQPAAVQTSQPATQPLALVDAKPLPAAYQTAQINVPQLGFEIARQFLQGASRFQVRLDPPELGRIDVRMDVDRSGNVHARLTVERSETLDLLQRDQRALERALAQSSPDGAKTNLEFSLKQNPFDHQQGNQQPLGFAPTAKADDADALPTPSVTLYRGTASAGGVNLFV